MAKEYDLKGIEQALLNGITYDDISDKYDINRGYITRLAKKYNWKIANKKTEVNTLKYLLDNVAVDKFNQMKTILKDQITIIDEPILMILANQYSTYVSLQEKIKTEGIVLYNDKGRPSFINPTYNAMQSVIKTLTTISKEFGLTIASRRRNKINLDDGSKKESSIFDIPDIENGNTDFMDNL